MSNTNMTVKDVVNMLADAKVVRIGYGGSSVPLDIHEPLTMIAYGDFIVNKIYASGEDEFDLNLATQPVVKS